MRRATVLGLVLQLAVLLPARALAWEPPEPSPEGWDWLRLDSDEWLKGEVDRMRSQTLYFESDKLDDLEIDWEDVVVARFGRVHTFRFEGRTIVRGTAEMREGTIKIRTLDGGIWQFPREQLVSIVSGQARELERWDAKIGFGLALRSGNTDQTDLSGNATIRRDTPLTRWVTDYRGAFSRVEGDRVTNNHRALTTFDYFVTRRFFVTIPGFEFYSDEFQNIDYRLTPGLGIGYEILDTPRVNWIVTTGVAFQYTEFDSGASADQDFANLFSMQLDFDLPRDIDFENSYQLQLISSDLRKTNHHAESVLSVEIWDPVDLDVTFIWDRIERPIKEGDGDRPDSDDFRLTVGLSLDF